jgi:hypothetical protein
MRIHDVSRVTSRVVNPAAVGVSAHSPAFCFLDLLPLPPPRSQITRLVEIGAMTKASSPLDFTDDVVFISGCQRREVT